MVRQGRGPVSVSKFRLRKKSAEEEDDEDDDAVAMDKRMSMMRLKKPSFMRLRRGPSMMRLKKMTQMRLKKSGMEAMVDDQEERDGCMWIGGNCYTRNEVYST